MIKKVLLYGNCQLGTLSNLINKRIKNVEIIRPQNFGIPITKPWHKDVFFPKTVLKNDGFLKALEICDIFIFQDIKNDAYWKTEELKKNPGKRTNVIATNFYFNYANPLQSVTNLENISNSITKNYNYPFIDMTPWIKQNYSKINILKKNTEFSHPIDMYFEYMWRKLKELNIFIES